MEKRVQDYTQDILAVVRSNTSPAAMSDKLGDFHANDIADAMPRLTVQERCKLYRILELDMLSDIFEYTDSDNAAEYVKEMDVKKGAAILSRMETDALVEVLHKIDKAKKKLLFELMVMSARHLQKCRSSWTLESAPSQSLRQRTRTGSTTGNSISNSSMWTTF